MTEDTMGTDLLVDIGDGADPTRFCESESANEIRAKNLGSSDVVKTITSFPYTYDLSDNDPNHFDTIDISVIAFSGTGTGVGTIKLVATCTMDSHPSGI